MAPIKIYHQFFGALILLFLVFVLQPFAIKARPVKFESLLKLESAQKGDTLNGLNQVKQYLKAFGYYPHDNNDMTNDRFDDSLESALKAYQQNFHLKATGKIDNDTIKTMMTPRCGIPDYPTNSNGAHTHTHQGNHNKFHFVLNYSFFNGSPKWNRYNLTYNFVTDVQVFTVSQLSPVLARAFQKWAAVSPFTFRRVAQDVKTADIRIGFYRLDHRDGAEPFTGPGGSVAHAFAPPDGRFHYDADENWSIANPTPPNQVDLEAIAVHEIGHNLGLHHSQDPNAIMFPSVPNGRRNVNQDDIDGLRALYGYP